MTDALDQLLASTNPITDDAVNRLTGPDARTALLAVITAGTPDPSVDAHPTTAARARRGSHAFVVPALAAAGVAAVVVLTGVALQDAASPQAVPSAGIAAPDPVAAGCPGALPGTPQVVSRGAEATFCVHVPPLQAMSADALAAAPDHATAPTAWSALSVSGGPLDVLALVVVSPFPPPAEDDVVVLAGTSDAFPDDVYDADGVALPTHRVFGLAGDGVDRVELVLGGGSTVPAVLTDGVWGAWWPAGTGGPDEAQVLLSTAAGTITTSLDDIRLPEGPGAGGLPVPFRPTDD